jgi:hypothetical protein
MLLLNYLSMKLFHKQLAYAAAAFALFFTTPVFGQGPGDSQDTRLGIGLSVGASTDDPYGLVIGGDLRLQKDFQSNVSGILSIGYTNFSVKDDAPAIIDSYGIVPLKVGLKIFPVERFYFSGEIGAGFGTDSGSRTAFVYAPGLGIGFNAGIDLGLRYEGIARSGGNLGQVALRLAYGFNLSR